MTSTQLPVASIVFPTRDRNDDLLRAIASAYIQTVPVEVLVMDDGSSSETEQVVRKHFPKVQYHRIATNRGPAFQRNRGIELAKAPIVFAIDDDAVFASSRTVEQSLLDFDHTRVGAVAVPYINIRVDNIIRQRAGERTEVEIVDAFVGAAHAVRRDVFLEIGGYDEDFFYMGEEADLCLRMLAAGHVVRLGRADPVEHHESPRRSYARANFYGRRNDVLFACYDVPMPYLPFHLVGTILNGLRAAATRAEHPWLMLLGTLNGCAMCVRSFRKRRPVSRKVYKLHRHLRKDGPVLLSKIEHELPTLMRAGNIAAP